MPSRQCWGPVLFTVCRTIHATRTVPAWQVSRCSPQRFRIPSLLFCTCATFSELRFIPSCKIQQRDWPDQAVLLFVSMLVLMHSSQFANLGLTSGTASELPCDLSKSGIQMQENML